MCVATIWWWINNVYISGCRRRHHHYYLSQGVYVLRGVCLTVSLSLSVSRIRWCGFTSPSPVCCDVDTGLTADTSIHPRRPRVSGGCVSRVKFSAGIRHGYPVAPCVPPETEADPVQRLFCQLNLAGALVVTHAMLRRLTSWRCIIIIIIWWTVSHV